MIVEKLLKLKKITGKKKIDLHIYGNIEDQTRACLDAIGDTLRSANCNYSDVVKSMVWLKSREDFPGFNTVYGEYFPEGPPARSALVSDFLVDIRVEVECIAYKPD